MRLKVAAIAIAITVCLASFAATAAHGTPRPFEPQPKATVKMAPPKASAGSSSKTGSKTGKVDKETLVFAACKSAEDLLKAGKNVEAKEILEKATPYDPNLYSANVHELLAEAYHNVGNIDESIFQYHEALKFSPRLSSATWNLALSYKDAAKFDDAITWARRFLSLNPAPAFKNQATRFISDLEVLKRTQPHVEDSVNGYLALLMSKGQANRWQPGELPLRVFVATGENVAGYRPEYSNLVKTSFAKWSAASGGRIQFIEVPDRKSANVTIDWAADPKWLATSGNTVVEQGVARTHFFATINGIKCIDRAEITLLTMNATTGKPASVSEMETTCLHEFGHALGLNGHSDHPSDIMYFSYSTRQLPALSKHDKATIQSLYADYPPL